MNTQCKHHWKIRAGKTKDHNTYESIGPLHRAGIFSFAFTQINMTMKGPLENALGNQFSPTKKNGNDWYSAV
jgi:hypothetical protein